MIIDDTPYTYFEDPFIISYCSDCGPPLRMTSSIPALRASRTLHAYFIESSTSRPLALKPRLQFPVTAIRPVNTAFSTRSCTKTAAMAANGESKPKMEYKYLGGSGLKISRVIVGAMSYGSPDWQEWVCLESIDRPPDLTGDRSSTRAKPFLY